MNKYLIHSNGTNHVALSASENPTPKTGWSEVGTVTASNPDVALSLFKQGIKDDGSTKTGSDHLLIINMIFNIILGICIVVFGFNLISELTDYVVNYLFVSWYVSGLVSIAILWFFKSLLVAIYKNTK